MNKTFLAALALSLGLLLGHVSAGAQDGGTQAGSNSPNSANQDIELLRKDIRSQKKQIIAANMPLSDTEAQKFWPVYDQYTADLVKINDQKYAIIKEYANSYGNITDEQAVTLLNRALSVDEQVTQLRIKYVPIFLKVLPGKLTASFFQIDRRVQAMIDLQIMAQLPLVQAQ